MQMNSTMTYSDLIPCFRKRFARENMAVVSSGIQLFMSALNHRFSTSQMYPVEPLIKDTTGAILVSRLNLLLSIVGRSPPHFHL